MNTKKNLKRFIYVRVSCLALGMALLLSYQGTQFFLHGLDVKVAWHMRQVVEHQFGQGTHLSQMFNYQVASNWEELPERVREVFKRPPETPLELQKYFENWWYFAPPETGYFLMMSQDEQGQKRYISHIREFRKGPVHGSGLPKKMFRIDPMVEIALWGLGAMLAFMAALYWTFRSLSKPSNAMYNWAAGLTIESAKSELPDFKYQELEDLAVIIQTSMQNSGEALEREKQFLGYASHELRTPITTLRSNATLLDRISPNPARKEREIRDRILRSSLTMKGITETLLWLNRDNQEPLPTTNISIDQTLHKLVSELRFLLEGKTVQLQLVTSSQTKELPEAAFEMFMTNIIRNAFQHTQEGSVTIKQNQSEIRVINSFVKHKGAQGTGFGLGLKLIKKIAERFSWQVEIIQSATDYEVRISLS